MLSAANSKWPSKGKSRFYILFSVGIKTLTHIPLLFFVLKILSAFLGLLHIQVHFRLNFSMEANTMNFDQTAP